MPDKETPATTAPADANPWFSDLQFRAWLEQSGQAPTILPPNVSPIDLLDFPVNADPSELIPSRYLCRGGSLLLAAPTGVGKSSFIVQFAISAAVGRDFFGMAFNRPLSAVIVQAENDLGDLAEIYQGVFHAFSAGVDGVPALSVPETELVAKNLTFYRETARSGKAFADVIRAIAERHAPDLIIVDPALAFLGGDSSAQVDVSAWLRNHIQPVLLETGVCLVVVHHSPKPLRQAQGRDLWAAEDFAYLGAGSAEWANWARAVLVLIRTETPGVFVLVAAKRGNRLGWKDADGKPVRERLISHARDLDRIYWRDPDYEETHKETKRKIAAEGFQRLGEVFYDDNERAAGLPAREIIDRAITRHITKTKNPRPMVHKWITGPQARAVAAGVLESCGDGLYRPKPPAPTNVPF